MRELQAALGGSSAASGSGTAAAGSGAAHWRNPSVAIKQALQDEHLAIRRMQAGPLHALRGRLEGARDRFVRLWRARTAEQARRRRERAGAGADAIDAGAGAGAVDGVPLHRRNPFAEADREHAAAARLVALEQQSRLQDGEGAFGTTDAEMQDIRRAAVAARKAREKK